MKKIPIFLLLCILVGAFIARLYLFSRPIADWHSWRQADTSSVSRYLATHGFDVLHPKFDDLSQGVSLIDNPQGHRFVEFPIYNVLQGGLYTVFGVYTIEEWGRLVTIFSQLVSIVFIYLIVRRYTGERAGLIASAFFAFIPYNVFYGRTVLPDSTMVACSLASLYFFGSYIENVKSTRYFLLTTLFTALAFLLKPYALFFMLPVLYLAWNKFGFRLFVSWRLILFAGLSLLPFVLWRIWMAQYPEGIPQSNWLFNGDGIRFKGAFFHWLFADRISRLILGYFGLPLVIVGIIASQKKEKMLYYSLLASSLLYMIVMAKGNVQHDYYQILIIPTLAIFFGKGVDLIFSTAGVLFNKYASYLVVLACSLFMVAFSWFIVRDYYNLQHISVVVAGVAMDKSLPKDAKVVAPYGGDTTFLYQINRPGWPVFDRSLKDFAKAGATHMAFVNPTPQELDFIRYFEVALRGENFIVYDLQKPTAFGKEQLAEQK